jgi:hypothetical protein
LIAGSPDPGDEVFDPKKEMVGFAGRRKTHKEFSSEFYDGTFLALTGC